MKIMEFMRKTISYTMSSQFGKITITGEAGKRAILRNGAGKAGKSNIF